MARTKSTKSTKTAEAVVLPVVSIEKTRVQATRERIKAERATRTTLVKLINDITDELSLDEDKMSKRIDSALDSEYGAINGLVNLVVAIAKWPVDFGDGANVGTNRRILESKFNLDLVMLSELAQLRGYHSFVTDDLDIIEGKEPDYINYGDYCEIFLEDLGVVAQRAQISPVSWKGKEAKAYVKAQTTVVERLQAVEEYKATQC